MFKEKFLSYVKSGFIAGLMTAIVSVVIFMVSSFIFGFSIELIGESRDTLYVVFILFVSFFAVFIGTIFFYLLQKFTSRPTLYFIIVVLIGFIGNTYMAEVDLLEQYKTAAHLVHVIVAGLAIYLIPRLNRK
ncbi:DUF6069 family protein [Anaerobacillus isosaccharinicus]|uniref:Uncharacterized protein n=1 Tax=Anaerobacillus isosaccharinicus TaxID=1532552 RepID=A0A1S2KWQ7_9BACI|nr:DUF6069 family protein [Anaerobacillus isosaccharinicus]MBA5585260.1 hypothetical protein [Anaerobacillus isosaccharinicus]QOY36408.1 hypothetical protein AWH56_001555 [Anaerobacillus isosaccharinicus]